MDERVIDEREFVTQLDKWFSIGRGWEDLAKFSRIGSNVQVSLVSIDNTLVFKLTKKFQSYEAALGWYGRQIDNLSNR